MTVGVLVNSLSGLLMVFFGLFVLFVARGARTNRTFATFAVAFGLTWIVGNLWYEAGHLRMESGFLVGALGFLSAVALARLGTSYPATGRARSWRIWTLPVAVALVQLVGWSVMLDLVFGSGPLSLAVAGTIAYNAGLMVLFTAGWFVLFFLARSHPDHVAEPVRRRAALLLSVALLPYFSFAIGQVPVLWLDGGLPGGGMQAVAHVMAGGTVLGYAAAWGGVLWRHSGRMAEAWLPLVAAFLMFAGFVLSILQDNSPGFGITRIFMVVVLGYAVVKHQLLGIDVKVRWGVSKSVVAGLFVAVFFTVVELVKWGTERLFVDLRGMPDPALVGIMSAGVLLFAISPLQRLADRIALHAVPVEGPPPGVPVERRETTYRRVVARYLADGDLTRAEERALAELAGDLGIEAGRAFALREEVEDEAMLRRRSP